MMLRVLAVCLIAVAVSVRAWGDRRLPPVVDGDVWSLGDSPVVVDRDLAIADLTIEEGVVVVVTGDFRIEVLGVIRALGTQESPVVFKPVEDNVAGWGGLYFEDTIDGSELRWVQIEGANRSGLQLVRSNPTINYVTFRDNAGTHGGGIRVEGSSVQIKVCLFTGNRAGTAGGAIYYRGPAGEADTRLEVLDSVFVRNRAGTTATRRDTSGGAIRVDGNGYIRGSTFIENEAQAYTIYVRGGRYTRGGAIYSSDGRTEVVASAFLRNACRMGAHAQTPDASRAYGGAIHVASGELELTNSIVAESVLSTRRNPVHRGSGLYVAGGIVSIKHSTFAENSHHGVYHDGGTVEIDSSILFFNNGSGAQIAGSPTVTYSNVQNGHEGEGNLSRNPIFTHFYRLASRSPSIDAGHPESMDRIPPGQGTPRGDQGYTGGSTSRHWTTSPCFLDADGDGYGDESSFAYVSSCPPEFVPCGGDCDDSDAETYPGIEGCPSLDPERKRFLRGDVDNSSRLDLSDGIVLLNYLFLGQAQPACLEAADADDNSQLNLGDVLYVLNFLFLAGEQPPSPYPECGIDDGVEDDAIGCARPHDCNT